MGAWRNENLIPFPTTSLGITNLACDWRICELRSVNNGTYNQERPMVVGGYAPTRILLDEAYHGVRHVGILQSGDLISGQLDVHRGQRIVEMVELSRADDRRGDHRLCQPSQASAT